jgi:predicted ThiF/HesA family dinucleotide-utilizing enzyme
MYDFSTEDEALAAVDRMEENAIIKKVLGKESGGIHVMFIDDFGKVKQVKRVKR